ncbi:magnesium transporter CorA family protein [Peptostreptococcus porci]|uniref:Magnesium transporter CorA family protein n=2 Tax=Peptostreptococcus porci TaxID=2652282 RepID=A0A6N7XFJ0_9FIRM|nr:magnesium transporter CorA family protein [Peptostreptococcus porci]MDD7184045.1 magnesium transporter CorA family protein [Peptostreptococcus porci]MDY2794589.1 magnesium transporter CorA family protein [Peptostreptococcus porci]MDY4561077.1 magnesium transporter CorA family protein [Peptostreptococcus porci]MDY5436086.1 magnesium transporter CorA family protein [Peptostreptococcus porci]MDY5480474.1 magnesium transporter CorA family protein [Peptostreptococcus porci]
MIRYYKSINLKLEKLNEYERSCWINLTEPTSNEIDEICELLELDRDVITAALDDEESSRIEYDEDYTLILIDIPFDMSDSRTSNYITIPLGIILAKDSIITICSKQTRIMNDFIVGHVKDFYTFMRTRFILQVLYRNANYYLLYLRRINKTTNDIEQEIYKSMKNKELLQLLQLEKSLVYFSTSLTANEATLDRLLKQNIVKQYLEDQDLLEDVIIENKQALQMSKIYGDILSRIMDAFSAIISNNQNNVMTYLTIVTIIMAVPTIISGLWGMNVGGIPFAESPMGFWWVVILTMLVVILSTIYLIRQKLL